MEAAVEFPNRTLSKKWDVRLLFGAIWINLKVRDEFDEGEVQSILRDSECWGDLLEMMGCEMVYGSDIVMQDERSSTMRGVSPAIMGRRNLASDGLGW